MKLRCSCCGEQKLPEWFSPRKGPRGRAYWCKACKRAADLRRFYRNRIARALDQIAEWRRRIEAIQEKIGPRRRKVSASPPLPLRLGAKIVESLEPPGV